MKRRAISILLIIGMMLTLTSCTDKKRAPEYFYLDYIFIDPEFEGNFPEGEPLDEELEKTAREVFDTLTKEYSVDKEFPVIKMLSENDMAGTSEAEAYERSAVFDPISKTIFLGKDSETLIPEMAHEMIHYLAHNDGREGAMYKMRANFYAGYFFDEGITQYLSTRVYPFPENDDRIIYEFETHLAEMFITAYGEEDFIKAYFSGDIDSLRRDFNTSVTEYYSKEGIDGLEDNGIKLDLFDIFTGGSNSYGYYLSLIGGPYDEVYFDGTSLCLEYTLMVAHSLEEMMLLYGDAKGVQAAQEESVQNLLKNGRMIPWRQWTDFSEMIK